jgi:lysophospholipase L1-like esterase
LFENRKKLSWGSGEAIQSHYRLLSQHFSEVAPSLDLKVLNFSHPGDSTASLVSQAKKLVRAFKSGEYHTLAYVVMTVGSNDACDSGLKPDLVRIRESLYSAIMEISSGVSQSEPVRVLVLGVPRIPDLGKPAYRQQRTIFGLSCETVRNRILHFCDSLTVWNSQTEYQERLGVVERVNGVLQEVSQQLRAQAPNVEVFYSAQLAQAPIVMEYMAADCFHPSSKGQQEIALQAWREQPWFRS